MNKNLPATLRRAADFLEAVVIKKHIAVIRWTPWYIEAIREAADELENFDRAFTEDALLRMTGQYLGTTPERLRELAREEQEGRLVVLPCKVGDWVYALWSVPTASRYVVYCAEVKEICFSVRNCRLTATYRLEPIEYRGRRKEYFAEDIGKTVFLTREEAEAALKGEAHEN